MAEGDSVQIQCEGAASDDENRIEWYFNNRVSLSGKQAFGNLILDQQINDDG
jgi:hypothetical protein